MPSQENLSLQLLTAEYRGQVNERHRRIHSRLSAHLRSPQGFYEQLSSALASGKFEKPSQYFLQEQPWIFKELVYPRFKDIFLAAVDRVLEYSYDVSWTRRGFRSPRYRDYADRIYHILSRNFQLQGYVDEDLWDILSGNLPAPVAAYLKSADSFGQGFTEEMVAYELDRDNPRLEQIITDIINGESSFATVSHSLIRGILMSRNGKMHKLLCDLLLAARLQEGLRQAICENADCGTREAFLAILETIRDNNLIRYSSVKRAVGTWLGIVAEDTRDLDRVSGKSVDLICSCLSDPAFREDCLASEDAMGIHIGLWSLGVESVDLALTKLNGFASGGTHHQVLTAGYFAANLGNSLLKHTFARTVLAQRREHYDILAVYLPLFLTDHESMARLFGEGNSYPNYGFYFTGEDEAREFCQWLLTVHGALKKKVLTFEPCIFPWHKAELRKSDLVEKAMVIAGGLRDRALLDQMCPLLPDCDADSRSLFFRLLTAGEKTVAARACVVKGLSDKSYSVRAAAVTRFREMKPTSDEYLQAEDFLRLRYEDLRLNVMELLLEQPDEALTGTIQRLLAASKTEKRTAGLDLMTQLQKQGSRRDVARACLEDVKAITKPTTQEQVLIDALLPQKASGKAPLFTEADRYEPVAVVDDFTYEAIRVFADFFPDSRLGEQILDGTPVVPPGKPAYAAPCAAAKAARKMLLSLADFFKAHEGDHYEGFMGNPVPLGQMRTFSFSLDFRQQEDNGKLSLPLMELWDQWQTDSGVTPRELLGMYVLILAQNPQSVPYLLDCAGYMAGLYGPGFEVPVGVKYQEHLLRIIQVLLLNTLPAETRVYLSTALGLWILRCLPEGMLLGDKGVDNAAFHQVDLPPYVTNNPMLAVRMHLSHSESGNPAGHFIAHPQIAPLLYWLQPEVPQLLKHLIPITLGIHLRTESSTARYIREKLGKDWDTPPALILNQLYTVDYADLLRKNFWQPSPELYLQAHQQGLISRRSLFYHLMQPRHLKDALQLTTAVSALHPGEDDAASSRTFAGYRAFWLRRECEDFIGKGPDYTPEQLALAALCRDTAKVLVETVLEPELRRGDSPAQYSESITGIQSLAGGDYFVRILSAMGKDPLERGVYYAYGANSSKKYNLSYLLFRSVPLPTDTVQTLGALLKGKDISRKRLIEAALFAPEWIELMEAYLQMPGLKSACYYFMAHTSERFDEQKKASIARYTPLSEEELNLGAFDVNWFRSAYAQLGEADFDLVYDAAKYISEGNKHTRARKFADAALGRLDVEQTRLTIADKRNKDLLMAWAVIPLENEADLFARYLYIQQFLKESRQFGAQRSASEKKAVDAALQNLATNAGFSDPLRLTLRMETKLVEDNADLFSPGKVGDWVFRLDVADDGTAAILCTKDGKLLKSIPAKAKKDPWVLRLTEMKKLLTDQYRRTRRMFEQAMEDGASFRLEELRDLYRNRVAAPILGKLVFCRGEAPGLFDGENLVSLTGEILTVQPEETLTVAHPVDLYRSGLWHEFQQYLFDHRIRQPFRQVFRELYVKTPEELGHHRSLRYSGNQIQPKKAAACLKERRWIADPEMGLQKVYYRENIVATLYALADWFTPGDIEAPTLEYVSFCHRKTGQALKIDEIPDVIFSEVMRDVDLAVSVAHAGGVDPETSHSTVEMRAGILEFTLPLLKLENVTIKGSHALIDGTLGQYSVHLGSGVVHQIGGAMLSVLPVHSQHRGRIFLPFSDEDPKTAEIISKVILFSEDKKLKDPTILDQISRK